MVVSCVESFQKPEPSSKRHVQNDRFVSGRCSPVTEAGSRGTHTDLYCPRCQALPSEHAFSRVPLKTTLPSFHRAENGQTKSQVTYLSPHSSKWPGWDWRSGLPSAHLHVLPSIILENRHSGELRVLCQGRGLMSIFCASHLFHSFFRSSPGKDQVLSLLVHSQSHRNEVDSLSVSLALGCLPFLYPPRDESPELAHSWLPCPVEAGLRGLC